MDPQEDTVSACRARSRRADGRGTRVNMPRASTAIRRRVPGRVGRPGISATAPREVSPWSGQNGIDATLPETNVVVVDIARWKTGAPLQLAREETKGSTMNPKAIAKVRQYYDENNGLYLSHVGHTCQAGLLHGLHNDPYRSTSLHVVTASGLTPKSRILDAGCGACGPSVHICQAVEDSWIVAMTISRVQAESGLELVAAEGLADRIRVVIGDYHFLPYEDDSFDAALFLESAGYSYDLQQLFSEVYRVVRPGGKIYIKDVFCLDGVLTARQQAELLEFDAVYAQSSRSVAAVVREIETAGFRHLKSRRLTEASTALFDAAMWEQGDNRGKLSAFGRRHYRRFRMLPVLFAEIVGTKLR